MGNQGEKVSNGRRCGSSSGGSWETDNDGSESGSWETCSGPENDPARVSGAGQMPPCSTTQPSIDFPRLWTAMDGHAYVPRTIWGSA